MTKDTFNALIISDFTVDSLANYLNNLKDIFKYKAVVAPFGQVTRTLLDTDADCWENKPDFAVVWTRPEGVIPSFSNILRYETVALDKLLEEVDEYATLLKKMKKSVNFAFIPSWVMPSYNKGYGMLDMTWGQGIANVLMNMNTHLSKALSDISGLYILNSQKWIETVGKHSFDPKLWYMGKVLFGDGVFQEAVSDINAAVNALHGKSQKMIILDLDDTLWDGIVGDDGWENLRLGGHDPVGESFVDFQRELKALTTRGIILGIVSKNEESVALEAIEKHPEMILKTDDFAGWRINWNDKARNISELVDELNLGLQSVVFIDNNPVERARVKDVLPEVLVPDWPNNKLLYKSALQKMNCFDIPNLGEEDKKRTQMYVSERKRKTTQKGTGSNEEWLKKLDILIQMESVDDKNRTRTLQLFNKTNQMNLSTRRLTETELNEWLAAENNSMWVFRVSDKFSDLGLTGIISLSVEGNKGKIEDFILSCRVMGRKVEETMIFIVMEYAKRIGLKEIYARYIQTAKNKPCHSFWKKSGFFVGDDDSIFKWDTQKNYPLPEMISLTK